MMRGRDEYEPPRFMSVAVAAQQVLAALEDKRSQVIDETEEEKGNDESKIKPFSDEIQQLLNASSHCVGLARVGASDQQILYSNFENMSTADLGRPLHCLIIPGKLHPLEMAMLESFKAVSS